MAMNDQRRVLLVGKSKLVLATALESLAERGYEASATDDFEDIAAQFDVGHFDLVVFGGQVPPDRKAEMTSVISSVKPDVVFVQGLAGIPGLIAAQVAGAFAARRGEETHAPSYDAGARTIGLSLDRPALVTVTAWWQTSFVPPDPLSDSRVVLSEELPAGAHTVALPPAVPDEASFASVQIDDVTHAFRLTA
jgi:hypothetical protein